MNSTHLKFEQQKWPISNVVKDLSDQIYYATHCQGLTNQGHGFIVDKIPAHIYESFLHQFMPTSSKFARCHDYTILGLPQLIKCTCAHKH